MVGAIFVPIMVMCIGAAHFIAERHADVRRAEGVLRQLDRLLLMTELRSALFAEQLAAEILVPVRRPAPELLATTRFGRTLIEGPGVLEARTDQALAALDVSDRPFAQSELDQARSDRVSWEGTIAGISGRLGPFYDRTVVAMLHVADPVRTSIVTIADTELLASGTTFERAIALPGAAAQVLRSLTDLYLAEPERRVLLQSTTAAAAATFDEVSSRFTRSLVTPSSEVARRWQSSPQPPGDLRDALVGARNGLLTTGARAPLEPKSLERTLLAGIDWLVSVDEIPSIAAAEVREAARGVVERERASEENAGLLAFAVIASSVLVVVALARSIVAPVRRLTDQAQRVGAGDMDVTPLPNRGPPDVAAACLAMNDVVGNLALIRLKALALADGRLSDPALQEPLPGPLGAEIERSTNELAATLIERKRLESQLVYDATHDQLTGLANRSALLSALAEPAGLDGAPERAVIFIDLNDFKRVNDRYGHAAGDRLLRVVADRLLGCTLGAGLVSRWGGDEFVIVLPATTGAEAVAIAATMVEMVSRPVSINGSMVGVAASAGVAATGETTIEDAGWASDLVRQADFAVYHAKSSGAGSVALFDQELGQQIRHQNEVEAALAAALDPSADELFLVFQPIVDASSGNLRGMEALVRWNHPVQGLLSPDDFIPVAERSDLIVKLDQWVLCATLRQLDEWTKERLFAAAVVSVNVSARSVCDIGFVDRVSAALAESSIPPSRLMLEITETALITDIEHASAQLGQLRKLGVLIAIDDFGTGFTSVSQLRNLPIDELKIDKSFVQGLQTGDNLILVRMINDLAHHLNIPTVAEGVETSEQRDVLTGIGCDALQGFLFAAPLDATEFARQQSSWARSL